MLADKKCSRDVAFTCFAPRASFSTFLPRDDHHDNNKKTRYAFGPCFFNYEIIDWVSLFLSIPGGLMKTRTHTETVTCSKRIHIHSVLAFVPVCAMEQEKKKS